jgi:Transcriptional regulator
MSTKQVIFDNALALFSQKGYDGVSVREIAKSVGIKESSIYNHYQSKKAILDDICGHFIKTLSVSRLPLEEVEKMLAVMRPSEVFLTFISSYGRQIDKKITQMANVIFSEQFHNGMIHVIFTEELVRNNVSYYEKILSLMEEKKTIKACDKMVLANVFNNEQIMLTIQFAGCETDEERLKLKNLMKLSAEYLICPLEVVK